MVPRSLLLRQAGSDFFVARRAYLTASAGRTRRLTAAWCLEFLYQFDISIILVHLYLKVIKLLNCLRNHCGQYVPWHNYLAASAARQAVAAWRRCDDTVNKTGHCIDSCFLEENRNSSWRHFHTDREYYYSFWVLHNVVAGSDSPPFGLKWERWEGRRKS